MARQSSATSVPTRERLIGVATRLFAEKGFRATSVGEIEAAAGLVPRRGTLYKHFASKAALLDAVVDARVVDANAFLAVAEVVYGHDLSTLPGDELAALVREFGRGFLAQLDDHRDLTRIVEHDGERLPHLRTRIRREVIGPGYRAVTETLQQLAPAGTDAGAHAALLLASLTGLRRTAWTFGARAYSVDDERALDAWTAHCLLLLRPPGATGGIGREELRSPAPPPRVSRR
jgi:AcrR family transcriptional regulator